MIIQYFGDNIWVVQVFIVVFFTLLINFLQKRITHKLRKKLLLTRTHWDETVLDAVRLPLTFLIWLVGLSLAVEIIADQSDAVIFEAIDPIRDTGVIFVLAWFLVRVISRAEKTIIRDRESKHQEIDRTAVDATGKLLRTSVIITAVLVMLQTLGYNISGVLAFGGIGGIAIGFAAKDLLANFFGGLMIYLDRPFSMGDWVRSPDKEIEGTVEHIGWRLTRIRTFDKRPLYVPNSLFANILVENPSRMTHRRIYETIGIRYDDADKMAVIVHDVRKMLQSHKDIDAKQTLIVNFDACAPSSLDFFIYTFTKTTDWIHFHEVKQNVLLKVMEIIESHGAEIAFPTSTLHITDTESAEHTAPEIEQSTHRGHTTHDQG